MYWLFSFWLFDSCQHKCNWPDRPWLTLLSENLLVCGKCLINTNRHYFTLIADGIVSVMWYVAEFCSVCLNLPILTATGWAVVQTLGTAGHETENVLHKQNAQDNHSINLMCTKMWHYVTWSHLHLTFTQWQIREKVSACVCVCPQESTLYLTWNQIISAQRFPVQYRWMCAECLYVHVATHAYASQSTIYCTRQITQPSSYYVILKQYLYYHIMIWYISDPIKLPDNRYYWLEVLLVIPAVF